ncbi:hypothetical protein J3R74_002679 [Puniceicoccus vermicola]|nr:hypothetical protein [Puniceicoccus vermicola]
MNSHNLVNRISESIGARFLINNDEFIQVFNENPVYLMHIRSLLSSSAWFNISQVLHLKMLIKEKGCPALETPDCFPAALFSIGDERRTTRFHPGHRYSGSQGTDAMRQSLSDAEGEPQVSGPGSIPFHGLRPAHLPGRIARYRSLFAGATNTLTL